MYKIKETVKDTIPSYNIDNLPERNKEDLLKKKQNWKWKKIKMQWKK